MQVSTAGSRLTELENRISLFTTAVVASLDKVHACRARLGKGRPVLTIRWPNDGGSRPLSVKATHSLAFAAWVRAAATAVPTARRKRASPIMGRIAAPAP